MEKTSRKETPHSELVEIQPWMSLGWSCLWKREQDRSFFDHTLSPQVKGTHTLNKILSDIRFKDAGISIWELWSFQTLVMRPSSMTVGCGAFKPVYLSAWVKKSFYRV